MLYLENHFNYSLTVEQHEVSSLDTMESDLRGLYKFAMSNQLTEEKYLKYVEAFVDQSILKEPFVKEIKKLINAYQTFNLTDSLNLLEKLCVQLLGHSDV